MTMESEGMTPFTCPTGATPACGQIRLYGKAGVAPCGGLDVPGNGVVSNSSTMAFTVVTGGGHHPERQAGRRDLLLVTTSWHELN